MSFRRRYYDVFSHAYDAFVRLHGRGTGAAKRVFLAEKTCGQVGERIIDLCTGTGEAALCLARSPGVFVIGIDFSAGMLTQARNKSKTIPNVAWVQADVSTLPCAPNSVDRATCAYAMYELPGDIRAQLFKEILRVLKPGGVFLMMEHLPPQSPILKLLYFVRIHVLGTKGVRSFAGTEERELQGFFNGVGYDLAPGGKTKVTYGFKPSTVHGSNNAPHTRASES